jgi:hypothetical protein
MSSLVAVSGPRDQSPWRASTSKPAPQGRVEAVDVEEAQARPALPSTHLTLGSRSARSSATSSGSSPHSRCARTRDTMQQHAGAAADVED